MARSMLAVTAFMVIAIMCATSSVSAQTACSDAAHPTTYSKGTTALGWGVNWNFQISKQRGDIEIVRTPTSLKVSSQTLPKYTAISSGITHSAVLESVQGKLFAVGEGQYGQIAGGPSSEKSMPNFNSVPLVLDNGVPTILNNRKVLDTAVGWDHTCMIVENTGATKNIVYCAGRNNRGQLGTTNITRAISFPAPLDTTTAITSAKIVKLAAGPDHMVALTSDGAMWTWGAGTKGELGNGQKEKDSKIPVQLLLRAAMSDVKCGYRYCLSLSTTGDLYGWGLNDVSQLGSASTAEIVTTPTKIASGVTKFAAGGSHVLAVINGRLNSWGSGTMGQTAQPKTIDPAIEEAWTVKTPNAIAEFNGVTVQDIAAGMKHSLVLDTCGNLWVFGSDALGQLGLGRTLGEKDSYRTYSPLLVTNIGKRKLTGLKVYAGGFNSFYIGEPEPTA